MTNKEFVEYIAPMIKRIGNARGYKIVSTTIAQAIIEGNYGKSSLAKTYHNHFGMKCGKGYKGKGVNLKTKEEYTPGQLTTITDAFRVYDSDEEGVKGYYDFISAKRYANLKTAKNYKEFATYLKQDGYATSSSYINTLCNCVKMWKLDKYDTDVVMPKVIVTERPVLKRGSVGKDVEYLHEKLRKLQYGCGGAVFNDVTEQCVINFQYRNNLQVDGVVGSETWSAIERS